MKEPNRIPTIILGIIVAALIVLADPAFGQFRKKHEPAVSRVRYEEIYGTKVDDVRGTITFDIELFQTEEQKAGKFSSTLAIHKSLQARDVAPVSDKALDDFLAGKGYLPLDEESGRTYLFFGGAYMSPLHEDGTRSLIIRTARFYSGRWHSGHKIIAFVDSEGTLLPSGLSLAPYEYIVLPQGSSS